MISHDVITYFMSIHSLSMLCYDVCYVAMLDMLCIWWCFHVFHVQQCLCKMYL